MQELLYSLGISDGTIKNMIELNPEMINLNFDDVISKIEILRNIKCTNNQICNIIGSNSMLFSKSDESIISLINYLYEVGFTSLNILFDSNPYILNLEVFEIKNYIDIKIKDGIDIINELESNTELFNEI